MTQLVPADEIEKIVGALRHPTEHYGRAVSEEETFYILHSAECHAAFEGDPRGCPFSLALDDNDRDLYGWPQNIAIVLEVDERDGLVYTDEVRSCRTCLCTDDHACTPPCSWVGPNLCSACATPSKVQA